MVAPVIGLRRFTAFVFRAALWSLSFSVFTKQVARSAYSMTLSATQMVDACVRCASIKKQNRGNRDASVNASHAIRRFTE
jgi:hypothetical protein